MGKNNLNGANENELTPKEFVQIKRRCFAENSNAQWHCCREMPGALHQD